jgi:beta-fructofuranosidase
MFFYTSIGNRLPEQWAAMPVDGELIHWKKHAANPLMTEKLHGETKIYEWRDPFVFQHDGRTYLVCGGNLNKSAGGQAVVLVYRAENDALMEWKYLGELFRHPDAAVKNIECPLFFPLSDPGGQTRWVLVVSPHGPVEYFVGGLDGETMKFKAEVRGIVDHGSFYAPNVMFDKQGRCLLWGWIRDFPGGKGWNGCLTVPRVLSIDANSALKMSA